MTLTDQLSDKLKEITGTNDFFNSGVLIRPSLTSDRLSFVSLGKRFGELVNPGARIDPTLLYMAPNSLRLPPHCHPGGEVAYVSSGEYFDGDMSGNPIKSYPKGSIVFYGTFSTHRPLSRVGTEIFYVPLNGIIFPGKNEEVQAGDSIALLSKMESLGAPKPALNYARSWMLS